MITIEHQWIKNIPTLVVTQEKQQPKPRPCLIYYHGFTSAKEHNLPLAYLLATEGYRVLLPDSHYHGEREKKVSSEKRQLAFWDIIFKNIEELQHIKSYLEAEDLLLKDRLGVAGTSMGGITTAASLTAYPWVKVAGILMGSPKLTTFAQYLIKQHEKSLKDLSEETMQQLLEKIKSIDLSLNLHLLKERPLFLWHGEADSVIPFEYTYKFYEQTKQVYSKKKHIQLLKGQNQDHKVSRQAVLETVHWFKKYL